MWLVVRINKENEEAEVLFESDSHIDCELFISSLQDKTNVEINERY